MNNNPTRGRHCKESQMNAITKATSVAVLVALGLALRAHAAELPSSSEVLKETGVSAGLAVVVGTTDGKLEADLAANGKFVVQGLALSDEATACARRHLRERGFQGACSVDRLAGSRLPYTDNLVNLVVGVDLGQVAKEEITRVLAPLGVAYVKSAGVWTKMRKPWPKEMDEWTHFRHDAAGTMMASDTLVGPARHPQWWGGPMFCRAHELPSSVSVLVSAGGRLYYVFDEGLVSLGETFHKNLRPVYRLVARDAFNGMVLWKRPIPDWGLGGGGGRDTGASLTFHRLVAEGDRVYVTLGMKAPVSALAAADGTTVREYAGTEGTAEILLVQGTLICRAPDRVMAFEAATGRLLWSKTSRCVSLRTIVAGLGGVAFADDQQITLAEVQTGAARWTSPMKGVIEMILGDDQLFCQVQSEKQRDLVALATADGKESWRSRGRGSNSFNALPSETLFFGEGTLWRNTLRENTAFDPATGATKRTVKAGGLRGHHPRCYPLKATLNYILCNKRGLEYQDLRQGGETPCDWTRGPCGVGVLPCNGLTYVPPNQCNCFQGVKLNGFWAYAAAVTPAEPLAETARFQRGPAFGQVNAVAAASDDWPAYRRDARLSASTSSPVPAALEPRWQTRLAGPLTSPVVARGFVFVAAVDEFTMHALSAETGKEVWRFVAGSRIDSPPTFSQGLLLFGSADGWVYALRAEDGALAWRYMMAPNDRRICSWGRIESVWPVHGSLLAFDGLVYAVAGRSTYLDGGVRICAFEPTTGRVVHDVTLTGPDPATSPPSTGMVMEGAFSDLLLSDGERLYMGQIVMDKTLKQISPETINKGGDKRMGLRISAPQGFLTDPWFSRGYWIYAKRWPGYRREVVEAPKTGTILCFNERIACALKGFDVLSAKAAYFYPAKQGYLLFADDVNTEPQIWGEPGSSEPLNWLSKTHYVPKKDPDATQGGGPYSRAKPPLWTARVPIRAHGLVLAAETLFVAGPPDVVDANDPLASFQGRMGGILWAVSAGDGKKIGERQLPFPPVFDGMVAAGGRLYLSLMDGSIMCLAAAGR